MKTQPEQVQENNLIKQLVGQGFEQIKVTDDQELVANFKVQLEELKGSDPFELLLVWTNGVCEVDHDESKEKNKIL